MKKYKLVLALISLGIIAILTVAALIYLPRARQKWTAPLGPELGLPIGTPTSPAQVLVTQVEQVDASPTRTEPLQNISAPEIDRTEPVEPSLTPRPQPFCGGPEQMTLLAIGADSGSDYLYGLADVIRLVRVDFVTPKVSVLSMPRDLWVEIPEIKEPYGITHGKLNQSYFYGSPGMGYYKGPGAGPGLLARTLDLNFGFRPDHY